MPGEPDEPLWQPLGERDNLRWEGIMSFTQLAASLARSAEEAAWRGNRAQVEQHLRELRVAVIGAIKEFNALGKP
jgi:hypothetical protein